MADLKKRYTVIPKNSSHSYYIVTKYVDGAYTKQEFVDYKCIHEVMNSLERNGYELVEDTVYLKARIDDLQWQINNIQKKIDKAIASGKYI